MNGDIGESDVYPYCPVCGADTEWADCWQCHGEGGWHDCGEDCCVCLDKEEITVWCDECDGEGGFQHCHQTHTPEQISAYEAKKATS